MFHALNGPIGVSFSADRFMFNNVSCLIILCHLCQGLCCCSLPFSVELPRADRRLLHIATTNDPLNSITAFLVKTNIIYNPDNWGFDIIKGLVYFFGRGLGYALAAD